jgi:uncharacterized membrane protein
MASQRTYNIINIASIICAAWYIGFGWFWAWLANVLFVFPIALIGFVLWIVGRRAENKKLNKAAGIMLIIGTVTSFGTLLFFVVAK